MPRMHDEEVELLKENAKLRAQLARAREALRRFYKYPIHTNTSDNRETIWRDDLLNAQYVYRDLE